MYRARACIFKLSVGRIYLSFLSKLSFNKAYLFVGIEGMNMPFLWNQKFNNTDSLFNRRKWQRLDLEEMIEPCIKNLSI